MIDAEDKISFYAFLLMLLLFLPITFGQVDYGGESASNGTTERQIEHGSEKMESSRKEDSLAKRFGRNRDSYLEALSHSRTSSDPREGIVAPDGVKSVSGNIRSAAVFQRRKEYAQGPVYAVNDSDGRLAGATSPRIVYGSPDRDSFSMLPSDSYSLPSRTMSPTDFHGIDHSYGPPRPAYGPPASTAYPSYGDHSSAGAYYLPSPAQQAYGSSPPYGSTGHGISETSIVHAIPTIDFSWPFALKLNAFTLAKILLKLVIFKMIVKFIALICLLLFVPKLEIKKKGGNKGSAENDDDEDEGRRLIDADSMIVNRLNRLTVAVTEAVDRYRSLNWDRSDWECRTFECHDESWQDYSQLLRSYVLEEGRRRIQS